MLVPIGDTYKLRYSKQHTWAYRVCASILSLHKNMVFWNEQIIQEYISILQALPYPENILSASKLLKNQWKSENISLIKLF